MFRKGENKNPKSRFTTTDHITMGRLQNPTAGCPAVPSGFGRLSLFRKIETNRNRTELPVNRRLVFRSRHYVTMLCSVICEDILIQIPATSCMPGSSCNSSCRVPSSEYPRRYSQLAVATAVLVLVIRWSAEVWYGKLTCAKCHTGAKPQAESWYDTIIYPIIPKLSLITNLSKLTKSLQYSKKMILYSKTNIKMHQIAPNSIIALHLRTHWHKMTLYRVNECVVYAVTEMVWYHPGWAVPLMLASRLLKGMIMHHMRPT